ncbi:MAG: hypothetical protein ABSA49_12315 [Rhizomicrobium sp.]
MAILSDYCWAVCTASVCYTAYSIAATAERGDPGRSYFPKSGVEKLGTYSVQTTRDLEDREIRETSVYRFTG